jgi:cell division protease FtsH
MAAETLPTPAPASRGLRVRLAGIWADRPAWARDPAVVGLAGSLLTLLVIFFAALGYLGADRPGRSLTLDQLDRLAAAQRIAALELRDQDAVAVGRTKGGTQFSVSYPSSDAVTADLVRTATRAGARVSVDEQSFKQAVRTVTTFLLPLVILANLFALLFLAGRAGGSALDDVQSFGTLRRGRKGAGLAGPTVSFADVAGADEAVEELREVVDYLRDPGRYASVGAVPPKGVLLFGPPGCGKTLLARAVAGEARVAFFSVAGAEFVESLVGVGAARVRDLFERVRAAAPAILFIDELDAAARRRGTGGSAGGADEREQTLNQLLVEIDGFDVASGIVVVGATNRPDILDPALLRPGRFDRHVTVDQPDHEGRVRILGLHARGKPMAPDVDLEGLARRTPGFTGADLANVINEAALLTVREGRSAVEPDVLEEAVQRVLHGPRRRGRVLSDAERRRAAVHEAGHAVAAAVLGHRDDVHRLTILARGRGLGLTSVRLDADAVLHTGSELFDQLVVSFGGLAAEELLLGEASTGSEQDLEQATELARELVGRFGMSERLGRARLLAHDAEEFLVGGPGLALMSDATHEAFDEEVRRLLEAAEHRAQAVIEANRAVVDAIVARLLERETLEGEALARALAGVQSPNGSGTAGP